MRDNNSELAIGLLDILIIQDLDLESDYYTDILNLRGVINRNDLDYTIEDIGKENREKHRNETRQLLKNRLVNLLRKEYPDENGNYKIEYKFDAKNRPVPPRRELLGKSIYFTLATNPEIMVVEIEDELNSHKPYDDYLPIPIQ